MKTLIKLLSLLLCAALVLAFAGCADNTKGENDTGFVSETVIEDDTSEFDALAEEIYGVQAGAAGSSLRAEEAAKTLVEYVKNYSGQSQIGAFELLLTEWLEKNTDVQKADFKDCLDAVVAAAVEADADLETDVSFLNVVNGFAVALAEDEEGETDDNSSADFDAIAAEIYGVQAGAAGTSLRAEAAAEALIDYVKTYGGQSDNGAFELLLNEWLEKNPDVSKDDFKDCLDAVSAAAIETDAELETDVSFLNVINGFAAALAD